MASVPSFWNGKLAGNVNLTYHRLVNVDIERPPYSDKLMPVSFFLSKRKGYKRILSADGWETTDAIRMEEGGCKQEECAWYFYQVSPERLRYRIIKIDCDGDCDYIVIDQGCRCYCGDDRFTQFDYVRGDSKLESVNGVQGNLQNVGPSFYDESVDYAANAVSLGDYIMVYGSQNEEGDGRCGQVRTIVSVNNSVSDEESDLGYTQSLTVDVGRQGFDPEQETGGGLSYKIFSDRGRVFAYHTCDGIKVRHNDAEQTIMCDYGFSYRGGRKCITSIREHNGILNFLNEDGFNFFGGSYFDAFYVESGNTNYINSDIVSTVSYRNFLMFFGTDSINTLVFDKTGDAGFNYTLREDIGIRSKDAYVQFENSLYFMATDKRIYAASITSDGDNFQLQLEDISARIKGDLDLIKDGDEVGLASDGKRMYVFISGKGSPDDDLNTKTKILIWNRDYDVWLEHRVCCARIINKVDEWYMGDGLYTICGYKDCEDSTYTSMIEAFVTDNDNQQTDGNGNPSDIFRKKKLDYIKFTLGKGMYTDDNTFIKIDSYRNGYKHEKVYTGIEDSEWVNNWNDYFRGETVEPSECFLDDLEECATIERKCKGSKWTDELGEDKLCCDEKYPIDADDYCVCVDSRAYALQPFYNMVLNTRELKKADLYKVSIISQGLDTLYFGGMVARYQSVDFDDFDGEGYDFFGMQCCKNKPICIDRC